MSYYCFVHNWSSRNEQCPSCVQHKTTASSNTIEFTIPFESKSVHDLESKLAVASQQLAERDAEIARLNQCQKDSFNIIKSRNDEVAELEQKVKELNENLEKNIVVMKRQNDIIKQLQASSAVPEPQLPRSNFKVTEVWNVGCPHCECEQEAPFNTGNPMSPLKHKCEDCGEYFLITYERD